MNVHEYQAKELLRAYGVPVALGAPAFTPDEAVAAAPKLPGPVRGGKAHHTPDKIVTLSIDPAAGYSAFHGRKIASALELEGAQIDQCVKLIDQLYRAFVDKDMALLEINPLVVTKVGKLVCLDAKINFE